MPDNASIHSLTQRNVETISQLERMIEHRKTPGEHWSETVFRAFGSWPFIAVQFALIAFWLTLNSVPGVNHWDPHPFALLALLLALQVAFASPIIVMGQNRQARESDARNHLNLQISLLSEQENTQMLKLLRLLCEKAGIELDGAEGHRTLEQPVAPEDVFRQIAASQKAD